MSYDYLDRIGRYTTNSVKNIPVFSSLSSSMAISFQFILLCIWNVLRNSF